MSGISTGVGLVSGLDIESIVTQLMSIESRPREQLAGRIDSLDTKRQALMTIQAQIMAVQLSAANFNKASVFQNKSVGISAEGILSASASRFADEGKYSFIVKRLASNHQMVSRGYATRDASVGTGQVSIEIGQGQLDRATDLSLINGQQGFRRGKIEITDGDGNAAVIDLTKALTVEDVVKAINGNQTINVQASTHGGHLRLTDSSTGTGLFKVSEVGDGNAAEDLGLLKSVQGGTRVIEGDDILYLTMDSRLKNLNDGNGVRNLDSGLSDIKFTLQSGHSFELDLKDTLHETIGDENASTRLTALNGGSGVRLGNFRITDRNGRSVDIDLSDWDELATMGNLKSYIEQQAQDAGMDLKVSFGGMDHIEITDNSSVPKDDDGIANPVSDFIVEDLDGGYAAADLGIAGSTTSSKVTGDQVWQMETLGDIANAINNHWNNDGSLAVAVNASGMGLQVTDYGIGIGRQLQIEAVNDSFAAEDLGLLTDSAYTGNTWEGRNLISGLNTVMLRSLNGGSGGDPFSTDFGSDRITNGGTLTINGTAISGLDELDPRNLTVQDVLDAVNDADIGVTARLNDVGNGLILEDASGAGVTVSGTLADALNLTSDGSNAQVDSGNLQLQYVSEASLLDDLRGGKGIDRGSFKLTGSTGRAVTIDLARDDIKTMADVVEAINNRTSVTNVQARINDNGDGLILEDVGEAGQGSAIMVEEVTGRTARDLGIFGIATKDKNYLDGSYELTLDIGGGDSLDDIVSRINDSGFGIKAALLNDGSSGNPYRLSLTSEFGGSVGEIHLDAGATSLSMQTMTKAQDAIVYYGSDINGALLISSHENTITDAIKGVTLDLTAVSDDPVDVTVEQDLDGIVSQMESFVEAYNAAMKAIDELTFFDAETLEKGELFADHTINQIEAQLRSMVSRFVPGMDGSVQRLEDVGISFARFGTQTSAGADGKEQTYAVATTPRLQFDETEFRAMFSADPEGVTELFTKADEGIGDYIADLLDSLAGTTESSLKSRLDGLTDQEQLYTKRISYLDELLASKEERLYKQFYAMETALAEMQTQQTALANMSTIAAQSKSSSGAS